MCRNHRNDRDNTCIYIAAESNHNLPQHVFFFAAALSMLKSSMQCYYYYYCCSLFPFVKQADSLALNYVIHRSYPTLFAPPNLANTVAEVGKKYFLWKNDPKNELQGEIRGRSPLLPRCSGLKLLQPLFTSCPRFISCQTKRHTVT